MTHLEFGGGARFQSLFFYCKENAFDMMDEIRRVAGPDANLQTLARGINVVGLKSQSSDVINAHAKLFAKHGTTTIRNFDFLNDFRNLSYSGQCIEDANLKHEVTITMMDLPPGCKGAHDEAYYERVLLNLLASGIHFDSLCYKDASGTSNPTKVFNVIKRAREILREDVHLAFHSHETAGICIPQYLAAIHAGINQIDLSLSPVSGGTSQPDVLTMIHALKGTSYYLDVDPDKVMEVETLFKDKMSSYFVSPESRAVEPIIPWAPMPGGALTANTQMLRDGNMMHLYLPCIKAMGEVVLRGGFGTSVTPGSQFYFQQAFLNVTQGLWEKNAPGYGKMVLGYFGKTPKNPDSYTVKLAHEKLKLDPISTDPDRIKFFEDLGFNVIKKSPLELNNADKSLGLKVAKKKFKKAFPKRKPSPEEIFIVATCGDKGITFLKGEAHLMVRKVFSGEEMSKFKSEIEKEMEAQKAELQKVVNIKEAEVFKIKQLAEVYGIIIDNKDSIKEFVDRLPERLLDGTQGGK